MDISIRNVLNYYYHHPQQMRHKYNEFIRTTHLMDGCIDFDLALRDPDRVWRDRCCYAVKYSFMLSKSVIQKSCQCAFIHTRK